MCFQQARASHFESNIICVSGSVFFDSCPVKCWSESQLVNFSFRYAREFTYLCVWVYFFLASIFTLSYLLVCWPESIAKKAAVRPGISLLGNHCQLRRSLTILPNYLALNCNFSDKVYFVAIKYPRTKAYLPGAGDTVINKAVLPVWGSLIALRLSWRLRVPQMWVPRARNFC